MEEHTPPLAYAELHCLSNFSFLRGASHPEELVLRASELGYSALALTDECSVAGVVRAYRALRENALSLKLIIGAEFRWSGHLLVILAPNRRAYGELCRLITRCRRRSDKGHYQLYPQDLSQQLDECLCLWRPARIDDELHTQLKQGFDRRLYLLEENLLDPESYQRQHQLTPVENRYQLPIVCGNDVHMHLPQRQMLQDVLTAIAHNTTVQESRHRLFSNAERHLRSPRKLARLYRPDVIAHTLSIAARCHFDLGSLQYEYPRDLVPPQYSAITYLRYLVRLGEKRRFPEGTPEPIRAVIEKELTLIEELHYEHFFITIHDIVSFARRQHILCQGRGSAANSVVCYCLGITEANPREVHLLFERFLSASRTEPPDIDVDFESQRREEVIQYIYQRYGRKRAALAATVITYRAKSALRDAARALGFNLLQLEAVIANYGWRYRGENWLEEVIPSQWQEGAQGTHSLALLKKVVAELLGFPRHLSQHVGGFVISAGPLAELVPIENATMPERTVIQWSKDDLEELKLIKVDILSLGMLTALRRCLQYLNQRPGRQGPPLRWQDIPRNDAATFDMICQADTVGTFQIESRAQMNMLPRLKPRCYYDLVVQVAIVRPGPIHGDMVHPYLKRRAGDEAVEYPMEALRPVLERTYGIPIFQEQIIHFAMVAADFSAAEADQLRRSMASWQRQGHMSVLRERLSQRMAEKGFGEDYIQRINRQIEGFGEYGFPESHAASFALLAYFSAWLKCHHPAAFCCALLNSQPMGFYSPSQLVQDARRHGVEIRPVCINHSQWLHSLEYDAIPPSSPQGQNAPALRLGLCLIKGLHQEQTEALLARRPTEGFASLQALQPISPRLLEHLASADALRELSGHRFQSHWQAAASQVHDDLIQLGHCHESTVHLQAPNAMADLYQDYQHLGLSLNHHPIELLRRHGRIPRTTPAAELWRFQHQQFMVVCGLVTNRQKPHTAANVTFITLEDETGCINVVVWEQVAKQFMKALVKARLLLVTGQMEKDTNSGIIHIVARQLRDLSEHLANLGTRSRDYH